MTCQSYYSVITRKQWNRKTTLQQYLNVLMLLYRANIVTSNLAIGNKSLISNIQDVPKNMGIQ